MKLWVDDLRPPPDGTWNVCQNSRTAIEMLRHHWMNISEMSLDHDLGGDDTSRAVVLWLCEHDAEVWPPVIRVHSMNVIGAEWLIAMINRYGPGVSERSLGSSRPSSSTFVDYPGRGETAEISVSSFYTGTTASQDPKDVVPHTSESACGSSGTESGDFRDDDRH